LLGQGPAGASAALFAAKAGKKVAVLDNDKSMTKRAWVENHYGVMEITGPELVETGKKQAENLEQRS
jgi:thioredoxin reductase